LFTTEEDARLLELVELYGFNSWQLIAPQLPGRSSRQCRECYSTYLCPSVRTAPWTETEDQLLFQKVREYGQRWSDIAKFFSGRTGNSIKNRWHLHLRGHHTKTKQVVLAEDWGCSSPPESIHQSLHSASGDGKPDAQGRLQIPSVWNLPFRVDG
jgi:hypothetical protein